MADMSKISEIRDILKAGKELPARLKETPEYQEMHDKHVLRKFNTFDPLLSEKTTKDLIDLDRFNAVYENQ